MSRSLPARAVNGPGRRGWQMFGKGDIYTIEEVAKALKVNKRTVYRWLESGELKYARLGRKTYRVFESDLKTFLKKYTK